MTKLEKEIIDATEDTIRYFSKQGIDIDYSIDSLKYIDAYYDTYLSDFVPKNGEPLSLEIRSSLFSIGAYVGQTIIYNFQGSRWEISENDSDDAIHTVLRLWDDSMAWPFEKVMKRFYNGPEDSIYGYVHYLIVKSSGRQGVNTSNATPDKKQASKKPWWKFWK